MTDLRHVLQQREATLASSLSNIPEFHEATAVKLVRRKRTTRTALTSLAASGAVATVGAGAWLGYGAMREASVANTTPAVSTTSHTQSPAYEGRNPAMSDTEALARAAHPATGETWLEKPQPVTPGAWATDDFFSARWGDQPWFVVGHRTGHDILTQSVTGSIVEVDDEGSARLIAAPRPDQDASSISIDGSPIPVDAEVYYDSLAVPATATTPEGETVDLRAGNGALATEASGYALTAVATIGSSSLVAGTREAPVTSGFWGTAVDDILTSTASEKAYFLRSPSGAMRQLPLTSLEQPVEWSAGFGTLGEPVLVDFFDQSCEAVVPGTIAVTPQVGGAWVTAGHIGERKVLAPTSENSLAQAMYAHWQEAAANGMGGTLADSVRSIADYTAAPALVAVPTDDPNVWWLMLNGTVSARAWC